MTDISIKHTGGTRVIFLSSLGSAIEIRRIYYSTDHCTYDVMILAVTFIIRFDLNASDCISMPFLLERILID